MSIPPALILALPLLMPLFFLGNALAASIFGPPAIWNRPWNTPTRSDLVGQYGEQEPRLLNTIQQSPATITLSGDGSIRVANLPYEFVNEDCVLSGVGTWQQAPDSFGKIDLYLVSDGAKGSCKSGGYGFLEVTGRVKPHGLYWVIGDPDSGTGVWLKMKK